MKKLMRSAAAITAGLLTGAVLSVLTDTLLEKTGIIIEEPFRENPDWVILGIVFYRALYGIAGTFVTARLAPDTPLRHVLILGTIGLIVGIAGAVIQWHIPPHWYPLSLIILTPVTTFLGYKLSKLKKQI
ncbi:MAG: hypothetical protein HZA79_15585 [Sphingobacteriales bacterium]|nr:hypothetical protein [Sphingobacteriales bacterium]